MVLALPTAICASPEAAEGWGALQDLGWCSPQAMLGPPTAFLPCSATMLRLPSAELLPGLGLLEDPVFLL